MKVYSYVVARDFGFAPNPFHGFCTLATCKPNIRDRAVVGDLIVGTRKAPFTFDIVFFMFVTEILSFQEYWDDPRFLNKRPNFVSSIKNAFGDNIYHLDNHGEWLQEDSHHTFEDGSVSQANLRTDTKSDRVLISTDFAYFGNAAVSLPESLHALAKGGRGYKVNFSEEFKVQIRQWVQQQARGVTGVPINW